MKLLNEVRAKIYKYNFDNYYCSIFNLEDNKFISEHYSILIGFLSTIKRLSF